MICFVWLKRNIFDLLRRPVKRYQSSKYIPELEFHKDKVWIMKDTLVKCLRNNDKRVT